jgi:hypothetical protein
VTGRAIRTGSPRTDPRNLKDLERLGRLGRIGVLTVTPEVTGSSPVLLASETAQAATGILRGLDQGWTKRLVPSSERPDFVRRQLLHHGQEAEAIHFRAEETRRQVAVDALGELGGQSLLKARDAASVSSASRNSLIFPFSATSRPA